MEHNLGLTCDPIGGLVQVPCIERNAMGAVKARQRRPPGPVRRRRPPREPGPRDPRDAPHRADMSRKYKETSRGGLAVNVTEC